MNTRFKDLYESIQSPIPAAIELLRHLFVSPSSIILAPLSKPVIQRLQWIQPSLEDVNESFLYFNNMIDHGASGRIHQLRLDMIHAGPSCWQVCNPDQVQYKVDEKNIESDGFLCEIFARVTAWKNENSSDNFDVDPQNKLAIILKLEVEESGQEEEEDFKQEGEFKQVDTNQTIFKNKKLAWKYFDLQDLVTPGLDSRPWFNSFESASQHNQSRTPIEESISDDQQDYWAGYPTSSEEESSRNSEGNGESADGDRTVAIDPILQARIQNTPLYRSKAPSLSSSIHPLDHILPQNSVQSSHPGPPDLLSRISRTPLFKRAPSIVNDDDHDVQSIGNQISKLSVNQLLKVTELLNLRLLSSSEINPQLDKKLESNIGNCDCGQSSQIMKKKVEEEDKDKGKIENKNSTTAILSSDQRLTQPSTFPDRQNHPHLVPINNNNNLNSKSSIKELEENLLNSLRSTFSFYNMSFNSFSNHKDHDQPVNSSECLANGASDVHFNLGERFIAFAHRVVVDQSSKNS